MKKEMRLFSRLAFSILLAFVSIGSVFAQVNIPSQTFDLGPVQGVWDQPNQVLTLQGAGKIDRNKWFQMKGVLGLTQTPLSKIEFKSGVQFPDDASSFFSDIQVESLVFPNDIDTKNVTTMRAMFYSTRALQSPVHFKDVSNVEDMGYMFYNSGVPSVSLGKSGKVKDMNRMFNESQVEKVEIEDTSNVTTMINMFNNANKLKEGNFSDWDTSKVTTMRAMFYSTRALQSPVHFKDVSNVEDMGYMFYNSGVPSVSLGKSGKVKDMNRMFNESQVEKVEIEDTSNVTTMINMFNNANKLKEGNFSDWDTSKVTTMRAMFYSTRALQSPVHFKDVSNVEDMNRMFNNSNVPSVILGKSGKVKDMSLMFEDSQVEKVEIEDTSSVTTMDKMFSNASKLKEGNFSDWDTSKVITMRAMFYLTRALESPVHFKDVSNVGTMGYMFYNSGVPSVILGKSGKVKDMSLMFEGSQVEKVEIEDTSSVTTMDKMFSNASKLKEGNFSDWDTSKVTTMRAMFYLTRALESPVHFKDVSNVGTMGYMFYNSGVPSVILGKSGKVKDMSLMFEGSQVEKVEIEDTSSVTTMDKMFSNASKLKEGNFSDWDTSKVTTMRAMFYLTRALESPVHFKDVSNVGTMGYMFYNSGVPSVILGKSGKVKDMNRMFTESQVERVEIEDTSNVENMSNMFAYAKKLKEGNFSDWDTSKAKNFSSMFYGASQFNQDLSRWDLGSASNLEGFIWSDDSFEQDNYEKILEKLEATNLDPATMQSRTIHVSSTYCGAASLRNKLTARGFVLNDKGMDCKIQVTFDAPTKQASGDIVDTKIRVSAKLPLDPSKVTIDPQTMIGNKDLSCQKDGDDNYLICSIKLTSTERGDRLIVQAGLDVAISSWTRISSQTPGQEPTYQETQTTTTLSAKAAIDGYLIDRIGPEKAQVNIDTANGINNPAISLVELPYDEGIGTSYCVMKVDDGTYDENNHLVVGTPYPFQLANLRTHTVWVKCYDELGNFSENEVKFPPIVKFAKNDVIRNDKKIIGEARVYSPLNDDGSENLISRIWVNNENGENIEILSCVDYEGTQYTHGTTSLKNSPHKPIKCTFRGDFPAGTDTHNVQIRAKADNGAEGWNSQTFIRDEIAPQITITPESAFTGADLTIQVKVFDAIAIDSNGVSVAQDSELVVEDRSCKAQSAGSRTNIICTGKAKNEIKDGLLKIVARDKAGNESTLSFATYTIDKTSPEITITKFSPDDTKQRSQYNVVVKIEDRGPAGLWKLSEQYEPAALSYGVADDQQCTNYQFLAALQPVENEPYEINFDFANDQFNGKYLCIKAVDKVGNENFKASADPLNVNIAPELDGANFQVDEHHHDKPIFVKTIGKLSARDANGDPLTYEIVSGNDDGIFTLDGNVLKTIAGKELDFETKPKHTLVVRVTDQYGLTAEANVVVTVRDLDENAPEISTIPNQRIKKNRPVQIPIVVTDDVGVKGIELSGLPKGLVYNPATKKIEGSTSDAVRDRTITVKVVDNQGNTAIKTFILTVVGSRHDDTSGGGKTCYGDCSTNSVSPNNDSSVQPTSQPDQKPQTNPNDTKKPDQKPVENTEGKLIKHEDTEIFNPTVENGKCYTRRAYLGIKDSEKILTSEEFKKALSFLRSYEMTMFDSVDGFAPKRNLSREEAAKIFSNFAINVLCRKPDTNLSVHYSDVENANPTLKPYITLAYQLGVMKGSGMGDGKFRPKDYISKAEVNAVLIRMILKSYLDESKADGKKWYSEYNKVATDLGILKQGAATNPVLRHNIALMLFRAYKNQVFDWRNIDYFSYVLKSRDLFVK